MKAMNDIKNIERNNIYVNEHDTFDDIENASILELSSISWNKIIQNTICKENEMSLTKSNCSSVLYSSSSETEVVKKDKITEVEKIIEIDYQNMKDLEVLEYQSFIAGYLRKNIKVYIDWILENNYNENDVLENFDKNIYLKYLNWLNTISTYFMNKIGLCKNKNTFKKNSMIPRSSYKFCDYNHECEYNYDKKFNGCYAQHFVHNIVLGDIECLISYFNKSDKETFVTIKEIKKCIDTISYVINHMYEELKNVDYYYNGKSDELHRDKTPKNGKNHKNNRHSKFKNKKKK